MTLAIDDINSIVASFIREHGRTLELVGVTPTDGGANRVELLITIAGCHKDPCRLLVNLTRADRAEFERELRAKLGEAMASHRGY